MIKFLWAIPLWPVMQWLFSIVEALISGHYHSILLSGYWIVFFTCPINWIKQFSKNKITSICQPISAPRPDPGQIFCFQYGIFVTDAQLSQERQLYSQAMKFQAFCWPYFKLFKNTNTSIKLNFFFINSDDFGKKFRPINAEIFNTHIRKAGGIMKSPVNPKKVCCWGLRNSVV